jgi:acetyl-CoA carboxylase biotin carboxylase subunit
MGDKNLAKRTMRAANVPMVPGSEDIVPNEKEGRALAKDMGYPVLVKASAGGGGRGMRVVERDEDFAKLFNAARTEAEAAFNNPDVYLEKYILQPRHIEIQLLGDGQGTVVHYGERECSIQRRHQKLVEEAPSPVLDAVLRQKMCEAAVRGAESVRYEGAGTVEFLVDANLDFYFIEMNTRIQVEHPVTEEVTDSDLIEAQIRVAMGERITPRALTIEGHAIECRINAENPFKGFSPSPGTITTFHPPGGHGVRLDTHAYAGYVIPPYYDSMIGKLIVRARTRELALNKMQRALDEFVIEGIKTTIPFHKQLMAHPEFRAGRFDTRFLDTFPLQPET